MSTAYPLTRDAVESTRLDVQDQHWAKTLGYHIHPRVEAALPSDALIADIGTGTGAWLLTLNSVESSPCEDSNQTRPRRNWTCHGFDISSAQFPTPATVPPNTTFTAPFDIKGPVPEHLHSKFDLVHLRLLILALDTADYAIAIANACSMLKPTGWLQWDELDIGPLLPVMHSNPPDLATSLAPPTRESGTYHLTRGITKLLTMVHPRGYSAVHDLWASMTSPQSDIDSTTVDRFIVGSDRIPTGRELSTQIIIGGFRAAARRELEAKAMHDRENLVSKPGAGEKLVWAEDIDLGPAEWTQGQYDQEIELMTQEAKAGGYTNFKIWSCFGRKADLRNRALEECAVSQGYLEWNLESVAQVNIETK